MKKTKPPEILFQWKMHPNTASRKRQDKTTKNPFWPGD